MKSRLDKKQYDLLVSSVKSENISEWNEWYAAHLKDTIHLRGTSVFGAHLDGADLSYLNLEGADLRFASLQGADLSYSYLKDANLEGANLFSANLWRASLDGTNLEGANPDSANFEPAGRLKFDAVQAELLKMGSDVWNPWYKSKLMEENSSVWLYGAYLEEVSLACLDLSGANLSYAHLEGADLRQVNRETRICRMRIWKELICGRQI